MKTILFLKLAAYVSLAYGILSIGVMLMAIALTQLKELKPESSVIIATAISVGVSVALFSAGATYLRAPKRKSALSAALAFSLVLSILLNRGLKAVGVQQYVGPILVFLCLGIGFALFWFVLRAPVLKEFPEV